STTGWSTLCNSHKSRKRRHGHPTQRGVSKAELAHYVKIVRQRKRRNTNNPFWNAVGARWAGLVEYARGEVKTFYTGKPMVGWEVKACDAIVKVAENVEVQAVVETALAMYLMLECDPRRFLSDEAFRFQLVRRIRGLTEVNAGTWWDHNAGRT